MANKRLEKLKQLNKLSGSKSGPPRSPDMPVNGISHTSSAKMDAELNYSKLQKSLEEAGVTLSTFLTESAGLKLNKPVRVITSPSGEKHEVVSTYLSYEELLEKCVIDPENVRDESERTEEALSDIIDDIGAGFQLMPIIAYINDEGKISIAEGSRRTSAAILRKVGLDCEIFDHKPTQETIQWVVDASDRKKKFSDHDLGKLYATLMQKKSWSAKDLSANRNVAESSISRRVNLFRTDPELKALLPILATTQAQTIEFLAATKFIESKKLVQAAVDFVEEQVSPIDCENLEEHKVAVIAALTKYVKVATKEKVKSSATSTPKVRLYEAGQSSIVWEKGSRTSKLNLQRLPQEFQEEIIEAVKQVIKQKQQNQ
ncbi:ParB N-terminal domain-containing protein [Enterovibrio norvegicus]|uniref:ParB N-terminal domain-containing protein n=1 Tax=Enterovibrio norvegicus TaxID=188144 RepID=UPI000C84A997|nr:ParB N-terminal domain-containing protein [Enterovibrio norvegicus]PMH64454.1 hypothetical protein BCU62_15480 [Enterovibrio norvegicus]